MRMVWSMARHHSTHASPASGSEWVSALTARAAVTMASVSPRCARATGPVRMREPLPPVLPGRAAATAVIRAAEPGPGVLAPSTFLVWMPTSEAPSAYQARKPSAMASSDSGVRRSAPVAATCAMTQAICVSSDHSAGAYGPAPPPICSGSWVMGALELVGHTERVAGCGGEQDAEGSIGLLVIQVH